MKLLLLPTIVGKRLKCLIGYKYFFADGWMNEWTGRPGRQDMALKSALEVAGLLLDDVTASRALSHIVSGAGLMLHICSAVLL